VHTVRIALVDDHDMLRLGVRDFVGSLPGYEIVGEATNARAALQMIDSTRPDVVLMDIALPGMDGIVATREIMRRVPSARVVVLSAHRRTHDVRDAIDAGAIGYVLKADPPDTLMEAIEHAVRGDPYVAPSVARCLSPFDHWNPKSSVLDVLTEREREIFRLAADCHTSPEIAHELCLARKTVETHLTRINRKLGLHDRASLIRLALGMGLVHSIRSRDADDVVDGGHATLPGPMVLKC